jgi:uncharacterized protein (TIGR03437 family)
MTTKFVRSVLLALLVSALLPHAVAVQVNYTLTGYVQANAQGQQVNTSFTWTVVADTGGITNPSPGRFQNAAISSNITFTGAGSTALRGVTVFLNTTTGQVTFGSSSGGIGLIATQLQAWDLASPIGPLNGTSFLVAGSITTDAGTVITLTGVANTGGGPSPMFQALQPPPTVTGVTNAASNIGPGLPNSGVAQGAIFVIYGTGLGPLNLAIAHNPFQVTSLSNTSVAVSVGGTTVNAPLYYTSAGQVSGLLPSSVPAGSGTIAVTYNGRTGPVSPITVVQRNLGIFTIGSNGKGPGIVTHADYSLVSPTRAANCGGPNTTCGSANPGDTLILWATGLGAVSGDDVSGAGLGQNMPNIPLQLWVGGVQAAVVYQGRSGCCVGEDQIVFKVPDNVPTGCAVPLVAQIGSMVSNATVMPIANGSRTCTGANVSLASMGTAQFQTATTAPVLAGTVELTRDANPTGQAGFSDNADFEFISARSFPAGSGPFLATYFDDLPNGTCIMANTADPGDNFGIQVGTDAADAGTRFTITGPSGSNVVNGHPGSFNAQLSANGTFLSPGAYTLAASGGADIPAFGAPFSIPVAPILRTPGDMSNTTVTRASGMSVAWTGGSANAYARLVLRAPLEANSSAGASVICKVAADAGSFNIPSWALLALPPVSGYNTFDFRQHMDAAFTSGAALRFGIIRTMNLTEGRTNFALR